MDCTMKRIGVNSVEFKTAKGVIVKINFSEKIIMMSRIL